MGEYHVYNCGCPVCKDERRKLKAIRGPDESISRRNARTEGNDSRPIQIGVCGVVRFLLRISAIRDGGDHDDLCGTVGVYCPDHPDYDPSDNDDS